jgi:hypothetical protein
MPRFIVSPPVGTYTTLAEAEAVAKQASASSDGAPFHVAQIIGSAEATLAAPTFTLKDVEGTVVPELEALEVKP